MTFENYDQAGIAGFEAGGIFAATVATGGLALEVGGGAVTAYSTGGAYGLAVYGSGVATAGATATNGLLTGDLALGSGVLGTDCLLAREIGAAPGTGAVRLANLRHIRTSWIDPLETI